MIYFIGIYGTIVYKFAPASATIVGCEMCRMSMKMHGYLREKMLFGLDRYKKYADFIPDWAARNGVKVEDLDKPNITISTIGVEF